MRDSLKDSSYFISFINEENGRIVKFKTKINSNEVAEERIIPVLRKISSIKLGITVALFSLGKDVVEINRSFLELIEYMEKSWGNKNSFLYSNDPEPYYTVDQYHDILTMLSLAYLLEVNDSNFERIVKLRDIVIENDTLLDFIINERFPRKIAGHIMQGNPYKELISIIEIGDKKVQENNLREFLENKWYKSNKEVYWYDSHKSQNNIFFGYWSFESAAVVKIMGLDDTSFKNNPYYPYDLVHWK